MELWKIRNGETLAQSSKELSTTVMEVMQRPMTKGYTQERKHNKMTKLQKV